MLIELTSFIFPLWSGIYLGTKNKEIPLVLEVNRASDILQALRLKKEFDLDLVLMSVEEAPLVLDQIQASGVSVIIDPMDNIPDSFDELASNIKLGGILSNAGIKVMFSTQRSHNYHLMRQGAGNAVAHGMNYSAGIAGMTSTVAEIFNIQNRGSIKEGNFADIVIGVMIHWNLQHILLRSLSMGMK